MTVRNSEWATVHLPHQADLPYHYDTPPYIEHSMVMQDSDENIKTIGRGEDTGMLSVLLSLYSRKKFIRLLSDFKIVMKWVYEKSAV